MGKANTGHSLPNALRAWKFCMRCQQNVKDLDNHAKSDGQGGTTPCK